jgi:FixJ family two-component response regulator
MYTKVLVTDAHPRLYLANMPGADNLIGVVEDDEGVRVALDGLLRSAGLRVATFSSAEALLSSPYLQVIACLILDLHLPGMDGLSLQCRLAEEGNHIPIIVLTAHDDAEARERAIAQGAIAFLTKPFNGDLLLAAVARALSPAP